MDYCRLLLVLGMCLLLVQVHAADDATTTTPTTTTSSTTTTAPTTSTSTSTTTAAPKKFKAVTLLDPPFVMHSGKEFTGLAIDILKEIIPDSGYVDFDLDIPKESSLYGWEDSLRQFTDLSGKVRDKEADIAIGAFTLTHELAKGFDVSQPIMHSGYRLLYKIPDSWHPGEAMVTLLRPFSPGLWVLILFMTVLTSVALYGIGRFSPYEDIAFVGKTSTYDGLTLHNTFLYTYSTLMWQGYTAAPKSISGRILVYIWWLFSIMTLAAYIAGLCVLLFRVNPEIRTLPFANMEEFSRQSKVELMVVANSSSYTYLNTSRRPLEQRLLQRLKEKNTFKGNVEDAIKKMMEADGKLALLIDSSIADYVATLEPCDKMVVGERLGDLSIGFICRNDTQICDHFNIQILKLKEEGRIDVLKRKYFQTGCMADKGKSYIFEGLPFFDTFAGDPDAIMPLTITITRFSSAFIILAIGIVIAGISLAVEVYWSKKRGSPVPQRINRGGIDEDTERIRNEYRDEVERA